MKMVKMVNAKNHRFFYLLMSMLLIVSACKDDDSDPAPVVDNPNQEVNDWIYENMDLYYLWTNQMPANPDKTQDPSDFFEGLLSNEDRFSAIVPSYQDLINSLNGVQKEAGYEFALFNEFREGVDPNNVVAMILFVKTGSPAEAAGLQRGDLIEKVNGTTMTVNNYRDILPELSENHTIFYQRFSTEASNYVPQDDLTISAVVLSENPNHVAKVLDIGGEKVGYFMYSFFAPGPDNTTAYDDEMDQIIGDFKSQGVTHLVLDLRYNGGGFGSSAINMASLMAPNVTSEDIFYENRWNDELNAYINTLSNGDDILRAKFRAEADNIGSQLAGQTVYVLVGRRTASASELVINGLLPYMNVVVIGEKTVGKNVGSIPIEDEENPENEYGMLPIVFRAYNSQGQSDYANGFIPGADNVVEEFRELPLEPLGDISEPLLNRALQLIGVVEPGSEGGRLAPAFTGPQPTGEALHYSIDDRAGSNRIIYMGERLK
jgi:C-terminal processing protease CtpA/Prc